MPTPYYVNSEIPISFNFESILQYVRRTDLPLVSFNTPANINATVVSITPSITVNGTGLMTFQEKMLVRVHVQMICGRTAAVSFARIFARLLFNNVPLQNFENLLVVELTDNDNYFSTFTCSCFLKVDVADTLRVQAWPNQPGTNDAILYAAPCVFTGTNAPSFTVDVCRVYSELTL